MDKNRYNIIKYPFLKIIIMKNIKILLTILIVVSFSSVTIAQESDQEITLKTDSIRVLGNCGMCKTRIEKAAMLEGVKTAVWNQETKILTVDYNPSVVSNEAIQKSIASVGHDTGLYKAEESVYNQLPGCCKYQRKE